MTSEPDLAAAVAKDLALPLRGVERALALFAEGATVPFVARYRKEATGGLDDVALLKIRERHEYRTELEARRKTILDSIAEQGKLTDELRARILATDSKTELEDLYLPFKPKRRTRATMARERGLEPLAEHVWAQALRLPQTREALARPFVSAEKGVPDVEAAWQGARDIVAERIADDADVRAPLRELALGEGRLASKVIAKKKDEAAKFSDYFDCSEPVRTLPGHRVLAMLRGESEGFLRVSLAVDGEAALARIRRRVVRERRAALAADLEAAIADSWERLLEPSIESDVRAALKERADAEAIRVFAENLRHLLLQAPLGGKRVLAIDPGFRTGCKVVALDETGALRDETVIYPHEPQKRADEARKTLVSLIAKHRIEAIAVGNGTAGRETHEMVRAMKKASELPAACTIVLVNESGASVYSASEIARDEFPDKDVTVRGAVSIGRRLQDPLAELVKIDPKSIGVGQYQHDVDQPALARSLDAVVESCVNQVGVDVNTASPKLLAYVSGIGETLAKNIVAYRSERGALKSRRELREVKRLGAKAFEQAAGFLRIRGGADPLDASAVHPESYDVVERMARDLGVEVEGLVGRADLVRKIDVARYVDERRGEPTLRDILAELEKPGRDPRAAFEEAGFRDDVTEFEHLQVGMTLQGVVTNVTAFGAFVDVGVHQDGLVHVSELANRFVKDPAEVVKVGDRVTVKVLALDAARRRIGLSMKQAR
jgi:protein Tex